MLFPLVLDPILREFLWCQNDLDCKNTFQAQTGQGIVKINVLQVMSRQNGAHNKPH
jgi:hypothetical protein